MSTHKVLIFSHVDSIFHYLMLDRANSSFSPYVDHEAVTDKHNGHVIFGKQKIVVLSVFNSLAFPAQIWHITQIFTYFFSLTFVEQGAKIPGLKLRWSYLN